MKELLEYIYSRGHRKIAYIYTAQCQRLPRGGYPASTGRQNDWDYRFPDEYIREAAYRDTATTYRMTNELLDLPDPPTCIIYPDDFASFGGINAIREEGTTDSLKTSRWQDTMGFSSQDSWSPN